MRILYHHRTLLDGAEGIHITEMIRAFEALGHEVTLLTPAGTGGAPGLLPRLVRRALPQAAFECAAALHNVIEERQAARRLRQAAPTFLYKRHALNDVGVLQAARAARIPSVLEVNTLYSSDALQQFEPLRLRRLARALERRALRLATVVVTVSTPLAALVEGLAPGVRPLTLPNGADTTRFSPEIDGTALRVQYGLDRASLVVGWSGIMRSWHGLELLLRVLAMRPTMALLLIGDGPGRATIEAAAHDAGVTPQIRFAGRVPESRVPEYLAAIDVGVVADDRTGYASPMKLVEYMSMGKAVVAPDLANIRELVTDGREGLLFERGNAASLAACLDRLQSHDVRRTLGRMGRVRVTTERTWTAIAGQVIAAITDAAPAPVRQAS